METFNWLARATPHLEQTADGARIITLNVGKGTGAECAYCHKTIDPTQLDYTVEAFVLAGLRTLHFHRACHHLWENTAIRGS